MSSLTCKEVPEALRESWRLTDLEISFVSACPQGANPGAKVILRKEKMEMGTNIFKKEDGTNKPVDVKLDIDALTKSLGTSLSTALGEMLAKDKNLSAEAMTEAVVAIVTGDLTKSITDVQTQLSKQLDDFQKEMDAKLAKHAEGNVNKDSEETLEMNGTTFKKSEVGSAAFAAIKASKEEHDKLRKQMEHTALVARVEKEFPNIAGTPDDKAALLAVIEKSADSVKATGLAVLKALNDKAEEFKKEYGSSETNGDDTPGSLSSDSEASLKLDQMAKELAAKEGISVAKAYMQVVESPEGAKLYEQHIGG